MSLGSLIVLLIIACICGSIAQALSGGSRGGCLVSIALGFIGAMLGGWMAKQLQLPEPLPIDGFPVLWSIVGGALFCALLSLITRRR